MPRKELHEIFQPGQSPYFGMYTAGYSGYTLNEVTAYCKMLGLPLRRKDVQNYSEGKFNRDVREAEYQRRKATLDPFTPTVIRPTNVVIEKPKPEETKLADMPLFPPDWVGSERRFFPCTADNKPMQKWGYAHNFTPSLYSYADARVLSPVGWVGQNMIYQKFVVIDFDGRGHGVDDLSTIKFGKLLADATGTKVMEDPAKPGSFHLYFSTDRIIPTMHFPWAKIDFMGNANNYAVYFKNKVSNNKEIVPLTDSIWNSLMTYQKERKTL